MKESYKTEGIIKEIVERGTLYKVADEIATFSYEGNNESGAFIITQRGKILDAGIAIPRPDSNNIFSTKGKHKMLVIL